jgi:AcrB/AcrD/AcrF family
MANEAAQIRMRSVLMTSFAFIFGVLPLAIATGAAAEMRQALGTAVFFGMLGVTFFGLIFKPVFYVITPPTRARWVSFRPRFPFRRETVMAASASRDSGSGASPRFTEAYPTSLGIVRDWTYQSSCRIQIGAWHVQRQSG